MTTYYVDGAVGDNANDGLSEGAGNAWATIHYALSQLPGAGGHIIYVKASATYSETATVVTAGSTGSPNQVVGYTSTTTDGGKITISGGTNCINQGIGNVAMHYVFRNIKFTGASGNGFQGDGTDYVGFSNCDFYSNGGHGCFGDDGYHFVNCTFYSNTNKGIDVDNYASVVGCKAYSNGGPEQLLSLTGGTFYKNVVYGLGASDQGIDTGGGTVIACTVDGENASSSVGITSTSTTSGITISDCIIYDVNQGLFNGTGATPAASRTVTNCLFDSNATWNIAYSSGMSNINHVYSAPAFEDEANDDYTLGEASPAIGAGLTPGGIT